MIEFELTNKDVKEDLPDYGPVGSIVDIRTYRRWLPKHNRRETFLERNERVVDANIGLVKDIISDEEYDLERSIMLDHMNKLLALPSGRSMWIAGTEANKKHPASSFNCSALAINRVEAFTTVFELLMLGTGVGFRVFSSDINKLPNINKFNIEFEDYKAKDKKDRLEDTNVLYTYKGSSRDEDFTYIKRVEVGDSRQGWIDALKALLDHGFNSQLNNTIVFNFNSVRPLGERINGFGGTASGHEALKNLLKDVYNIINECPTDKLRSIDCLDICCAIAKGVVAGNTRRSALLCLFEEGDDLMANAKVNLFDDPNLKGKYYRIQSNNTEALGTKHLKELRAYLESNPDVTREELWKFIDSYKPSVEWIKERFKVIANAGDPGFCNYLKMIGKKWLAVRKYRPNVAVKDIWDWFCDLCSNPCFRGDTLILTKTGYYPIKDLVGKVVDVWDGTQWVSIDNFRVTGQNQEVYTITLHSGQTITATPYHKFILKDGTQKQLKDLQVGDYLANHDVQYHGTHVEQGAYLKGFLLGDGTSIKDRPMLHLYETKYNCKDRLIESCKDIEVEEVNTNCVTTPEFKDPVGNKALMQGLACRKNALLPWVTTYRDELPYEILNWSLDSKLEFLAGFMDADGTASETTNGFMYQITSVNPKMLDMIQKLLISIGVKSTLRLIKESGESDFGEDRGGVYNTQPVYRITISQKASILLTEQVSFSRLVSFSNKTTSYNLKDKSNRIESIEFAGVEDKVYCCTVPSNHQVSLGIGVVTGQCFEIVLSVGYKDGKGVSFCNLTTLPINKFVIKKCNNNDLCAVTGYKLDESALEQAIRLTVRMATRQTCVTMPRAELDDTQKAERLLGVSVTGWIQLFNKLDLSYTEQEELMEKINSWANDEATIYSSKLGIDRPLMVCCIKPEGTQAKVLGSSSGVHWDWAPYYINRIQMGANDALAKTLKEQGFSWIPTPYDLSNIYKDCDIWNAIERFRSASYDEKEKAFINSNAVLFEFPINSGMVESQGSVSASRQLQNVLRFTDKYVDHMVSSTITAKEDEWDNLAEELHAEKNWSRFFNAAFLSYYSGNHPLLPNEQITENQYNSMMASFKDSEWVKDNKFYVNEELLARLEQAAIAANVDIDDVDLGSACSTGGCPLR